MITVDEWCAGGIGRWGDECSANGRDGERLLSKLFLKEAVTTEAESLFQYFTTFTEDADLLLRRWLAPWGTL